MSNRLSEIISVNARAELWDVALSQGLSEDRWVWDWTTLGTLFRGSQKIRAKIIAKSEGVWAAQGLLKACEKYWASEIQFQSKIEDSKRFKNQQTLCEWKGSPQAILALERTFLNLASFVCGIATRTRRLVDQVEKACPQNPPRVTSTRKTLPGYKDLSILGVILGGGASHRLNLSAGVLIKENHVSACGDIATAVKSVRDVSPHGLKIEIEVRNLKELQQAMAAGAEGVLLDNFTPAQVQEAIRWMREQEHLERCFVEVSGGLNENNIQDYAIPGVSVLSVGGVTHSVQSVDLSLLVEGT